MNQPNLCQEQVDIQNDHLQKCKTCKASYDSYMKNMKIPMTPPCNEFESQLKQHINSCTVCSYANKKWNENAIDITPEMRRVAASISSNKMPDKKDLGATIKHLTKRLGIDIT